MIVIIILSMYIYIFSKNDVLAPLATLHESACRILKGDFSYKIKYNYDTNIGKFCRDFESMRDEIKFAKEKEIEIKINNILINGDKKRLSQVMYNLVSNSIKY